MMGKLKTEHPRGLRDVVPLHQQTLSCIDDVSVYVVDGCRSCIAVYQIAEIMWRIGHLRSTIGYGRQSVLMLSAVKIILFQKGMKPLEDIVRVLVFFVQLPQVNPIAVFHQ